MRRRTYRLRVAAVTLTLGSGYATTDRVLTTAERVVMSKTGREVRI